jgi:hypothetical protein
VTDELRNNAETTRGRPFEPGNPGRPKGAKHKTTRAIEALLEGEAEALTRKAIDKALEGDNVALKMCLDRLSPPPKDSPVAFELPAISTAADAATAMTSILAAVAEGSVTPAEGETIARLIETFLKSLETVEFEQRLRALEEKDRQ